jgi:hypothetical protein
MSSAGRSLGGECIFVVAVLLAEQRNRPGRISLSFSLPGQDRVNRLLIIFV